MSLPDPIFEEFGDGIKVTVFRAIGDLRTDTEEANQSNHEANEANTATEIIIKPELIAVKLAEKLSLTDKLAEGALTFLSYLNAFSSIKTFRIFWTHRVQNLC